MGKWKLKDHVIALGFALAWFAMMAGTNIALYASRMGSLDGYFWDEATLLTGYLIPSPLMGYALVWGGKLKASGDTDKIKKTRAIMLSIAGISAVVIASIIYLVYFR